MNKHQLLLLCLLFPALHGSSPSSSAAAPADANNPIPAVIQAGFAAWPRGGITLALDTWQKGGLIEADHKLGAELAYFKRMEGLIGGFKSYEFISAQRIGASSQVLYLSLNFERAAIFARFLLYRTDQDWVVQNMDFNAKPEAIIPWMAFSASTPMEP